MRKRMIVTNDGRGTWAGREVQTDMFPVVGVPDDVNVGDMITAEYRSTSHYSLWFFISKRKDS